MTQSINDEAVCRTAPAKPGLLNFIRSDRISKISRNPLITCQIGFRRTLRSPKSPSSTEIHQMQPCQTIPDEYKGKGSVLHHELTLAL